MMSKDNGPRILFIDVETRLAKVYSFGIWQQTIRPEQILEDWSILSYSAQWLGEDEVIYSSLKGKKLGKDKTLAKEIAKLLDEATHVIAHNGDGFDIPKIMERILCYEIKRPSYFKTIDTKKLCKKHFGFTSNSLAYVCQRLGIEQKLKHKKFPGLELWKAIEEKNKEAWDEMEKYNRQDTKCLKALFLRIQPYCRIPSLDQHKPEKCVCGANRIVKNGKGIDGSYMVQRYICQSCRAPYQTKELLPKNMRQLILRKV